MDDAAVAELLAKSTMKWLPFDLLLCNGSDDRLPKVSIVPDVLCYLPYSSGTTGMPKGVMVTHKMMCAAEAVFSVPDRYYQAKSGDSSVLPLPMFHMFAFIVTFSLLQAGVNIVALHKFNPYAFLQLVQRFRPTILFTAPPLILLLAKDPIVNKYDVSSLECVFIAAAPIGSELLQDFSRRHPNIKFIEQGFGMTETVVSHRQPKKGLNLDKAGSVGPAVSNCKMKIVSVETGNELTEPDARGELCLQLPTMFAGYLNRPEETAAALKDGWLYTGDIGYVDADGHLYVVDRLKELIKVKGFQVAPSELEDVLLSHPAVAEAAVTRVPHPRLGEAPVAFLVLKQHRHGAVTEREIQDFVKEKLAPYKQLAGGVHFVHYIPRLPSGKILRRQLRDELATANTTQAKL